MSGITLLESPRDRIERWVMFAVEFLDPVTGITVSDGLYPRVEGLPPPWLTPSRRFAWRLDGPAASRNVTLGLRIANPMYGPPQTGPDFPNFSIAPNDGTTKPEQLLKSFPLTTTPYYVPPPGSICAVGTLVKGAGSKDAKPGVKVRIGLSHSEESDLFLSRHVCVTDDAGAFAAVAQGLGDQKLDPLPGEIRGSVRAWLKCEDADGTIRDFVPVPPLRLGRLTYLTEPIKWSPDPP